MGSVRVSTATGDALAVEGTLWHRADSLNQCRALSGAPWVTRCGIERPALRKTRYAVDDVDVCVVCVEIERGLSR